MPSQITLTWGAAVGVDRGEVGKRARLDQLAQLGRRAVVAYLLPSADLAKRPTYMTVPRCQGTNSSSP